MDKFAFEFSYVQLVFTCVALASSSIGADITQPMGDANFTVRGSRKLNHYTRWRWFRFPILMFMALPSSSWLGKAPQWKGS